MKTLLLSFLLMASSALNAEVILPKIINSHMILQRGVEAPIWGWADQGEEVKVSFAGQTKKAMPDKKGKWMIKLNPLKASSEAREMIIEGNNKITLSDVLVGEVWLASGQSNMEWDFMRVDKAEREYAMKHADNKLLRAFHVNEHVTSGVPLDDTAGLWKTSNDMVGEAGIKLGLQKGISAVGFCFALKLQQELGVPVAFIDSNWGGRRIESFIPDEGYEALGLKYRKGGELKAADVKDKIEKKLSSLLVMLEDVKQGKEIDGKVLWSMGIRQRKGQKVNAQVIEKKIEDLQNNLSLALEAAKQGLVIPVNLHGFLGNADNDIYNAMISPLTPFAIKGAIWYQGESNRTAKDYFQKLQALSIGWSKVFNVKDIPLHLVQIAPFQYDKKNPKNTTLCDNIWTAQYEGAQEIAGMTVVPIHDTNIPINNIHPPHKLPLGNRLALRALKEQYGKGIIASGPNFSGVKLKGSSLVVSFDGIDQGLSTKDGKAPSHFEVSADGKTIVAAEAKIDGSSVIVSSEELLTPKYVRMGWYETALPNLQDKNGWPVFAFSAKEIEQ